MCVRLKRWRVRGWQYRESSVAFSTTVMLGYQRKVCSMNAPFVRGWKDELKYECAGRDSWTASTFGQAQHMVLVFLAGGHIDLPLRMTWN